MIVVKEEKLKELEKYGFDKRGGIYYFPINWSAFEIIVNPYSNETHPKNAIIVNCCVDDAKVVESLRRLFEDGILERL